MGICVLIEVYIMCVSIQVGVSMSLSIRSGSRILILKVRGSTYINIRNTEEAVYTPWPLY